MKNKQIMIFGATLALVLALVFWFVSPAFTIDFGFLGTLELSFADVTFGTSTTIAGATFQGLKFSVLNLIPLVLLILSLALLVLKVLGIKLFANKDFDTVLVTLFSIVAGAGFLLVITFTGMTNDVSDTSSFELGLGAILSGALSLLAGLLTLSSKFVE